MTDTALDDETLTAHKAEMRQAIRTARRAIPDHLALAKSQAAVDIFFKRFIEPVSNDPKLMVAGFWPSRYEIKVDLLLKLVGERKIATCLPEVVAHGQALIFKRWSYGDPLVKGNGAEVPLAATPTVVPNFVIVPLIGFDRRGGRLGQGGGFYDRTLALLRQNQTIRAVGIAFAEQEVAAVPRGQFDLAIDAIVTDREVIYPK